MKPNEITFNENKIKENWLARSGLLGQAAQGAATLSKRNQLAAQIGEQDFIDKLSRGLKQAISAGAVSGTPATPTNATPTNATLAQTRQLKQAAAAKVAQADMTANPVLPKQVPSVLARVNRAPQIRQQAAQANNTSKIKETDNSNEYFNFSRLVESVILGEAPMLSMSDWLQKFVEKQIALEKLPELDDKNIELLKVITSEFEKEYYKSNMVPISMAKKLFSFLQNWESTNARVDPYFSRSGAGSATASSTYQDPRRAIATELLRTPLNGSDSYKGLREIISSLIMNTSLQNPLSLVPLIKDDVDNLLKQKQQQQQAQQQNPAP